ncbi:MFS transporter [Alsobacter sp. SYSU M60028]|uniref:MFS transporter n=1 Tax=Alsobacter ponti TaxID=2962936 RepID=A0ABT1LAL7_9HYPH|nr:MFS transporter [Alsobacter ponti]MCP8938156.1 MFS transporter [Alsobacter ponti]
MRKAPQLAPFQHPVFRAIWLASLASNMGGLIQNVGAAWLMTAIGGSRGEIALVQASQTVPIMLFSLAAGAIADNFDRRRLMLAAQCFLLLVSLSLTVVTWSGHVTPWMLLGFTFLVGCGTAFNGPAWQSLVGEMVPRSDLSAAISLNAIGFNVARSIGPAIGGVIVATVGAFAAFAINTVSYVGLIGVLARWKPQERKETLPPERLGSAMLAGLRFVSMSPGIFVVLGRGAVFGFGGIAVQALMPLIARDLTGGGAATYGLLLGGFGVGAVFGAFFGSRLRETISLEMLVRIAFVLAALCAGLAGLSSSSALAILAMLAGGGAWTMAMSSFNAAVQLSAPRWVVGRALALYQMATFGGMSAGSWVWGLVAEDIGTRQALYFSAATLAVGAAIGLRYVLPDMRTLREHPPADWNEPDLALAIRKGAGPVFVTIEFIIDDADVREFLAAMADRRRVRIRNGARHWSLLRDLADPRVWTERYDTPTWHEYVRQNQRMTQADVALGDRLRALHRGEARPRVRRMIEDRTGWTAADRNPDRRLTPPAPDPGGSH